MAQLVKLQERAEEFKAAKTEVIVVFREESDGIEGLQKSQKRSRSTFRLALDKDKQQTPRWSPGHRQFANYVIDRHGIVREIIDGDLKDRATADELFKALQTINSEKADKE